MSCARRCTSSPTAAIGASRCDPRGRHRSSVRTSSTRRTAVEGLVPRTELPVRTPAEGPVPPALAARRRGARRRRSRRRRRGHRVRARLLPGPRACGVVRAAPELDGRPATRAGTSRSLRGTCSSTARAWAPSSERVEENPLRMLDSKREDWQDVIERAPQLTEHLSDASREHFEQVQRGLDALGIALRARARLVRGFDYYTSTTFEFVSERSRRRAERDRRWRTVRRPRRGDGRSADAGNRVRHRDRALADRGGRSGRGRATERAARCVRDRRAHRRSRSARD